MKRKPIIIDKELSRHKVDRLLKLCGYDELWAKWALLARFGSRDVVGTLSESIHERSRK